MVEALRPEDAPELMRLAAQWQSGPIVISPGAHGAVVRDAQGIAAWALLRELSAFGFVTDELWCRKDYGGHVALAEIGAWLESTVARIAAERGLPFIELGGLVRLDNPAHDAALAKHGYEVVGHMRSKKIPAAKAVTT